MALVVVAVLATYVRLSPAGTGVPHTPVSPSPVDTPHPTSASPLASPTAYLPVITPAATRLYWGALVNGLSPTSTELDSAGAFGQFESRVGKQMAIVHWGQAWRIGDKDQPFQTAYFDNVRNHGSIPLLSWGSWALGGGPTQTDFQLNTITAGLHDNYIRQWAQAAKTWGHPLFLRFDWEMNGNWQFPWSEQLNQNRPGDYVKAWRHVHDIFIAAGTSNVTWVWCPNIASRITTPYASLYPGDAYVDWTCLDGYNFYESWQDFGTLFTGQNVNWIDNSYQELLAIAPNKPIMIAEIASLEAGDGGAKKAAWITDALAVQLPYNFPNIRAVVWYDWVGYEPLRPTIPLESSAASIAAFASAIASSHYLANEYAHLDASPIPPP